MSNIDIDLYTSKSNLHIDEGFDVDMYTDEKDVCINEDIVIEITGLKSSEVYWIDIKGAVTDNEELINKINEIVDYSVEDAISEHNTSSISHQDIRTKISNNKNELTTKINSEIENRKQADKDLKDYIDNKIITPISLEEVKKDLTKLTNEVTKNKTDINNKVDEVESQLTTSITEVEEEVEELSIDVNNIKNVIPDQASSSNKLADINFVNSSIATSTATFKGTFNKVSELPKDNVDENDYAFVISTDSSGNTLYNRYKYSNNTWLFEYALNNSSFTSIQWETINSGLTSNVLTRLTSNEQNIENEVTRATEAENNIKQKVKDEEDRAKLVETGLNSKINVTNTLLNEETSYRISQDNILQQNIDTVNSKFNNYRTKTEQTSIDNQQTDNLNAHINNKNNPHEVSKEDIGLGNVDNTSDYNKPISYATQLSLNDKQDKIPDLTDIRENSNKGKQSFDTISTYGDIVTHNADDFLKRLVAGENIKNINNHSILGRGNLQINYNELDNIPKINNVELTGNKSSVDLGVPTTAYVDTSVDTEKERALGVEQGLQNSINTINGKIPEQATTTNQLADKNFVNSSIASETANFVGTFDTLEELQAVENPTNNDYGFVKSTDELGNKIYKRYKYNSTDLEWKFEYDLNNSSFTAVQWDSINSGATSTLIGQITTNKNDISNHKNDTSNPHSVTKAQVGLENVDNTSDLNKPISTATQTALNDKANDTSVVHLTGDETISGVKTLSNTPVLTSGIVNLNSDSVSVQHKGTNFIRQNDAGQTFVSSNSNTIYLRPNGDTNASNQVMINTNGSITATSITGNVTGNLTGDVTGNLTGSVNGNVNGNVTGNLTGDVTGNLTGNVTGDLTGNVTGNLTGDVTGNVTGNADTATKATQDSNGNNIVNTYVSNTKLEEKLLDKQDVIIGGDSLTKEDSTLNVNTSVLSYDTGDIDIDRKAFVELRDDIHSTFDINKFENTDVVNVSYDGIASGFKSGSVLKTINIPITTAKNIEFKIRTYIVNEGNTQVLFNLGSGASEFWGGFNSNGIPSGVLSLNDGLSLDFNKNYDFHIKLNLNTQTKIVGYKLENEEDYTYSNEVDCSELLPSSDDFLYLGGHGITSDFPYAGNIDLKYFSIIVDDIQVFNGNKTGIDQIKKDDYTVVGLPTITEEGVASGFSVGNYINTGYTVDLTKTNQEFEICFTTAGESPTGVNKWLISAKNRTFGLNYNVNNKLDFAYNLTGGTTYTKTITYQQVLKSNTTYFAKVSTKFNSVRLYVREENEEYSTYVEGDLPTSMATDQFLCLGYHYPSSIAGFTGSIDINAFKIYVDDQLVYQPTLRIPYTQSKTGNKIVDSVYRDRVQDMYEQFGYTHYYTLGDVPEKYNVDVVGSPTLSGGIASGFSASNYLRICEFNASNNTWTIVGKLITSSDVSTNQKILGADTIYTGINLGLSNSKIQLSCSSNGISMDIVDATSTLTVTSNTIYYFRISFDGYSYKVDLSLDNNIWINYITGASNKNIPTFILQLGAFRNGLYPFKGSLDLSQFLTIVNGEVFRGYEPPVHNAYSLPKGNLYGMLNSKVNVNHDQTIYGVKTFSSDSLAKSNIIINDTTATPGIKFTTQGSLNGLLGVHSTKVPVYSINGTNIDNSLVRSTWSTAVGHSTKPVYISSTGVATACNDMVDFTTAQTISAVKTFKGNSWDNQLIVQRDSTVDTAFAGIYCKRNNATYGSIGMDANGKGEIVNNSGKGVRIVTSTLNTAIGSTTKPVYIDSNGIATACTYSHMPIVNTITSDVDCNTLTTSGFYIIKHSGLTNLATSNLGTLLVNGEAPSATTQTFFPDSANNIYIRRYNSSTTSWEAWKKIPFDSAVVHNTGNETVAGTKTFTGNPVFQSDTFNTQGTVKRNATGTVFSGLKYTTSDGSYGSLGFIKSNQPVMYNATADNRYNLVRSSNAGDTAVGSTTQPVYVSASGAATACNTMCDLASAQTISGVKTFSATPKITSANLILQHQTEATVTQASQNPKITFNNVDGSQTASLIYCDYDSYEGSDSITMVSNQANPYFIAPHLRATNTLHLGAVKTGPSIKYNTTTQAIDFTF